MILRGPLGPQPDVGIAAVHFLVERAVDRVVLKESALGCGVAFEVRRASAVLEFFEENLENRELEACDALIFHELGGAELLDLRAGRETGLESIDPLHIEVNEIL